MAFVEKFGRFEAGSTLLTEIMERYPNLTGYNKGFTVTISIVYSTLNDCLESNNFVSVKIHLLMYSSR